MSQKPRRTFTAEQKAQAVAIVKQSGKPISQVAQEMGLTESALRQWVKQATIDQGGGNQGAQNSFIVGVNCLNPACPDGMGKSAQPKASLACLSQYSTQALKP